MVQRDRTGHSEHGDQREAATVPAADERMELRQTHDSQASEPPAATCAVVVRQSPPV